MSGNGYRRSRSIVQTALSDGSALEIIRVSSIRSARGGNEGFHTPKLNRFGATDAALRYNTVPRAMATVAARWLRAVFMGYLFDIGIMAKKSMRCIGAPGIRKFEPDFGLRPENRK